MHSFKLFYLIPFIVLYFLPMWYIFQLGKKTGHAFCAPTFKDVTIRQILTYIGLVTLFFLVAISFVMNGYIKAYMLFILPLGLFPGSFLSWACGINTGRQIQLIRANTKLIRESYGQS